MYETLETLQLFDAICSWVAGSLTGNWGRHPGKNDGVVVALAEIELLRIVQDDSKHKHCQHVKISRAMPCLEHLNI